MILLRKKHLLSLIMKSKLTLLIYMAADNNLNESAEEDLESLQKGSIYSEMDIVVQLDRWEFVDEQETIRYHIKNGEIEEIARLGETNTGDPKILKSFIEESAKAYPSEKLMVIVWSHGTGVDDFDIYSAKRERYFVPEEEIEEIVEYIKAQRVPEYDESYLIEGGGVSNKGGESEVELDPLYEEAKAVVLSDKKTSISYLQRKLQIGYNRSANIIEQLEATGVLSAPNAKGNREIIA